MGIDTTFDEVFTSFKNEINSIAGIDHLCSSTNVPGDEIFWASGISRADEDQGRGVIYIIGMDEDYIPAFDIEILAGRNFSSEYGTEDLSVIINEKAIRFLGYDSPEAAIGQKIRSGGERTRLLWG